MAQGVNNYLVVIGDREPLASVLRREMMAFSAERARMARLEPGDAIFVYATRGCFRNPTTGRSRVIGEAAVLNEVAPLDEPVTFGDRTYTAGCGLKILSLAPLKTGVNFASLAPKMHAFPVRDGWGVYLRRPLVPLDAHHARLLRRHLAPLAKWPTTVIGAYIAAAHKSAPFVG